jgi:hypothetical protein
MESKASDLVVLRRSPRTIEKICDGIKMGNLTLYETGVLLSLAQCSGWSADRIKLKISKIADEKFDYKAEDIWSFHWQWILKRGEQAVSDEDIVVMLSVLKREGITLSELGRPLNTTEQPVSSCVVYIHVFAICQLCSSLFHLL